MKLTIKLDPTVGQLMRSLKRKINNLIFNWFKKPYLNYQQRRFEKSKIAAIHREFKKNFNVSPSYIVELMHKSDVECFTRNPTVKITDEEHKTLLLEQLKKSAYLFNKIKPYNKASFFYEPEIIDIHNESLDDNTGPHIKELIAKETTKAGRELRSQEKSRGGTLDYSPKTNNTNAMTRQSSSLMQDHLKIWGLDKEKGEEELLRTLKTRFQEKF